MPEVKDSTLLRRPTCQQSPGHGLGARPHSGGGWARSAWARPLTDRHAELPCRRRRPGHGGCGLRGPGSRPGSEGRLGSTASTRGEGPAGGRAVPPTGSAAGTGRARRQRSRFWVSQFVHLPQLSFRHEVCPETGGDSRHPVLVGDSRALSVPATELEQRRGQSVTWKHLDGQRQRHKLFLKRSFLSTNAAWSQIS